MWASSSGAIPSLSSLRSHRAAARDTRSGLETYVEFLDTRCRDGTPAGVGLSLNKASTKLLIYLESAMYCFDGQTCLFNAANVDDFGIFFNTAKQAPSTGSST